MNDLFEQEKEKEIEKRTLERVNQEIAKIVDDPDKIIEAYRKKKELLEIQVEEQKKELEVVGEKAIKWTKFLDADGYLDVSEVAEKIKVPYIDPTGKKKSMGLQYFCKLLTYDRILLPKATGYGLYRECSKVVRDNSKVISNDHNGYIKSSVKFNAKALEWLDDKYSNDIRVWKSTSTKEIYYE